MWREGLLLKLQRMGIEGRFYNWVLSFLFRQSIQVKVGNTISEMVKVENGTPQGSAISPLLFNIMINDVFEGIHPGIKTALYADDGAMWKRGRNVKYTVKTIQEAIEIVENWSSEWGFRFSISKTCCQFFTKKRIAEKI